MSRLRTPFFAGFVTALLVVTLAATYRLGWRVPGLTGLLDILELHTLDWRFELRGQEPVGDEVVLVVYDDATFQSAAGLFQRRQGWVTLFSAIGAAGARVIGVDALFTEPEQTLDPKLESEIADFFRQPDPDGQPASPARALLERVYHETQADERLAAAIGEAGNLILGFHLGFTNGSQSNDPSLIKAAYGQAVPGPNPPGEGLRVVASLPDFNARAQALGVITVSEDATRSVRKLVAVRKYRGAYYAPMAVKLVAAYRALPSSRLVYLGQDPAGGESLRLGDETVALAPGQELWLNFRGPNGTFPTYSAVDLVAGRLPADALRDKIVLVGYTFFGHDTVRNPYSPAYPGVEIHATAVDNLLRDDFLSRAPWWVDALVCLAFGLAISLLFWRRLGLTPLIQVIAALALLLAYLGLGVHLFVAHQIWIMWSGPMLVFLLVAGVCLVLSYLFEGLERRHLRKAFEHYLSGDVIEQLVADPGTLKLGGERRELSVLFSDIRGFTTISEGLAPEALSDLLNGYLTPMSEVVFRNRGTLDKYMGDAIMAIYGAPVPDARHAERACISALEMIDELERLRADWRTRGLPEMDIGIGINTGPMSVGNMGSKARFDYTVLGDQVNLGSRLEGLNKQFGTRVIISEFTLAEIGAGFCCRELDLVAVKGRLEPVRIFELIHRGPADPGQDGWIAEFEQALGLYRGRAWDRAAGIFTRLVEARKDAPSQAYLARCEQMRAAAPGPDWDGVYRATSK